MSSRSFINGSIWPHWTPASFQIINNTYNFAKTQNSKSHQTSSCVITWKSDFGAKMKFLKDQKVKL